MRIFVRRSQEPRHRLLPHNHELRRVLFQLDLARIDIRPCLLHDIRQIVRPDAYNGAVSGVQGGQLERERAPQGLVRGGEVGDAP